MTWSPGDLGKPEWFNKTKWFRRLFPPFVVALIAGAAWFLWWFWGWLLK